MIIFRHLFSTKTSVRISLPKQRNYTVPAEAKVQTHLPPLKGKITYLGEQAHRAIPPDQKAKKHTTKNNQQQLP
jgi:hypothetical protein